MGARYFSPFHARHRRFYRQLTFRRGHIRPRVRSGRGNDSIQRGLAGRTGGCVLPASRGSRARSMGLSRTLCVVSFASEMAVLPEQAAIGTWVTMAPRASTTGWWGSARSFGAGAWADWAADRTSLPVVRYLGVRNRPGISERKPLYETWDGFGIRG